MVLVEVSRKPYLASLVPVIVNAILNEHQIIVDIVAFVNKGDFPKSRLGEKQRGKILGGWVSRKLRTLAQFSIRDMDAAEAGGVVDGMDQARVSMVSVRSGGNPAPGSSSLRNAEQAPQIPEQEEFEHPPPRQSYVPSHSNITETSDDHGTPTTYKDSHVYPEVVPQAPVSQPPAQLSLSPQAEQAFDAPDFSHYGATEPEQGPLPAPGTKPEVPPGVGQAPPQIRLPGVDGREDVNFWGQPNRDSNDEADWTADAIMHMNLAGGMNPR